MGVIVRAMAARHASIRSTPPRAAPCCVGWARPPPCSRSAAAPAWRRPVPAPTPREMSANPVAAGGDHRKAGGRRARNPGSAPSDGALSVAHAKLTPPDEGRFSLAAVGLSDWRLDRDRSGGPVGDRLGQAAGGRDVLIYVHGFNQTFESALLDAARLSDGIRFRGETWHSPGRRRRNCSTTAMTAKAPCGRATRCRRCSTD